MLISLEWLNDYIDLSDLTTEKIMEILTDLGLEVEGVEKKAPLPPTLVVGEIMTAEKHPNADSLRICTVNVGKPAPLTIVCGAPNARIGLKAAVAQIGTVLPGNFEIKPAKIRGQASEGMMCSEKELGLSDEDAGLWELDAKWTVGTSLAALQKTDDTILEISLTPNRADCLSYVGIARDLAARLKRPLKLPAVESVVMSPEATAKHLTVTVDDAEKCGRFCALRVTGVNAAASPAWLKRRLEASGMRPINAIVDATNYVLLEMGQPVHAYDERYLEGNMIRVRTALVTDKLKTLDGQDAKLKPGDILICDGSKPVGLAGIMGGESSEVRHDTSAIVVEVAEFDPLQIRRTSKRLGLHTEASHRFERGVDIEQLPRVAMRVAEILCRVARELNLPAPQVSSSIVDHYPKPRPRPPIALRLKRIRKILGLPNLAVDTCISHLKSLGFKLLDSTDQRMLFEVPAWRQDMTREIDLIEEVARIEGFDKIPYEMPTMAIAPTPEDPTIQFIDDVKIALAGMGITEVITFPFTSQAASKKIGINEGHPLFPSLRMANPLNEEMNFMQTTLMTGLVDAVIHNRRQGIKGSRLFEVGRGYFDVKHTPINKGEFPVFKGLDRESKHFTERARKESGRPVERQLLAGILDFPFTQKSWSQDEVAVTFFHGKDLIFGLFKSFGIGEDAISLERPSAAELPFLHPGASAVLKVGETLLGWVGELHPRAAVDLDFSASEIPVLFELDLDQLLAASARKSAVTSYVSKFPPIMRDIALLVERKVSHRDLQTCFQSFPKKQFLRSAELFDVYQGDNIPANQQSYAYSLAFQSQEKTLTDKEVDGELSGLLDWVKKSLGAVQR